MCSALFHMNVPTRWSPVTPRRRSAFARRAASRPRSPYDSRRASEPVQVMTSLAECTDVPWRSRFASESWLFCLVLNMVALGGCLLVVWGCADSSADRVKQAWSTTAPFGHGRRAIGRRPDDDHDHQLLRFSLWARKCAR